MTQERKQRWDIHQQQLISYTSKGILACSFKHEVDGRSERITGLLLENTSKYDEVREIIENGVKSKEGKGNGAKAQEKRPKECNAPFVDLISDDEEDVGSSQRNGVKDRSPRHASKCDASASGSKPETRQLFFEATMTIVDVPLYALEKSGVWERNETAEALFCSLSSGA